MTAYKTIDVEAYAEVSLGEWTTEELIAEVEERLGPAGKYADEALLWADVHNAVRIKDMERLVEVLREALWERAGKVA